MSNTKSIEIFVLPSLRNNIYFSLLKNWLFFKDNLIPPSLSLRVWHFNSHLVLSQVLLHFNSSFTMCMLSIFSVHMNDINFIYYDHYHFDILLTSYLSICSFNIILIFPFILKKTFVCKIIYRGQVFSCVFLNSVMHILF